MALREVVGGRGILKNGPSAGRLIIRKEKLFIIKLDNKFIANYISTDNKFIARMKNIVGQTPRGADFFPRDAIINRIYRRLDAGSHIFLAAPRRVGKTSIMRFLGRKPFDFCGWRGNSARTPIRLSALSTPAPSACLP